MNGGRPNPSNSRGVPWSILLNDVTTQDSDSAQEWFDLQAWEFMSAGNENPDVTDDTTESKTAAGSPKHSQGAREMLGPRPKPEKASPYVQGRGFNRDVEIVPVSDDAPSRKPRKGSAIATTAQKLPSRKSRHRRLKPLPDRGKCQRGATCEDAVRLACTRTPPSNERTSDLARSEIQIPFDWEGDAWRQAEQRPAYSAAGGRRMERMG